MGMQTEAKRRHSSATDRAKEIEEIHVVVAEKNVLITGGASGLGAAYLKYFLLHGANKVTILDIDDVVGQKAVNSVEKSYGADKVIFVHADVSVHEEMVVAFKKASQAMGGIDIVVNNAGILDERRWEREIAVNINGMISGAMLAMEHMGKDKGAKGGILINVAQHLDAASSAQLPIYTATKHAIIGLSQSIAAPVYLERTGVRVLTLCPGLTETGLMIESPNKLLSRVMKADFVKNLDQLQIQTPYIVAQGLMTILRIGEPGSIWVLENGEPPYEVFIPDHRTLRRSYKNGHKISDEENLKITPPGKLSDNMRTGLSGLTSCA